MTRQEAMAAYDALMQAFNQQKGLYKPVMPAPAAANYNARNAELWAAWNELQPILEANGVTVLPPGATPPPGPLTPPSNGPAPSEPSAPSAPPQSSTPTGTSFQQQAAQIGKEISPMPVGTRADTIAARVTELHLGQEDAAEAANIAAQNAYGGTSGIANLPNGMKVVLPKIITSSKALMIDPNGVVSVFEGNLYPFLEFLR